MEWTARSRKTGHPWVVTVDEAGTAATGTPPDADWPGMAAIRKKNAGKKKRIPTVGDIRAQVLWGTLMGGSAGVEYYFGYRFPENDLDAENWRSRAQTWHFSKIALAFFHGNEIPFWEMENRDALVGNAAHKNSAYCFSKKGGPYVIYLRSGKERPRLDLRGEKGSFSVAWFNPREGGALEKGSLGKVTGGGKVDVGSPPADAGKDWAVLLR